ncbi:hypothetical protein [Kurthia zopfii]|nr:hypothetical protein [Kurthia zopfii]
MSINHDIRNLLEIQDSNIYFATNCVNQKLYKGRMCKFILTNYNSIENTH